MALELYFHPLASYCHKVPIALYERDIALDPIIVDLGDEASRAAFAIVWPLMKFPILRDTERNCTIAESATIGAGRSHGRWPKSNPTSISFRCRKSSQQTHQSSEGGRS